MALSLGAGTGQAHTLARPARSLALAFARAVNLRPRDVPGFMVSPDRTRHARAEKTLEDKLRACVGPASPPGTLVQLSASGFERSGLDYEESVNSAVSVAPTSTIAATGIAAIRSSHVARCLIDYFDRLLKAQREPAVKQIGSISISPLRRETPGAKLSFALRISSAIIARGFRVHVYADIIGFVYGQAQVTLLTSGAPRPFPSATEQGLLSLLLRRARAHRS